MTAKQKVKAKYPRAYAAQDIDGFWHIWCPTVRGALSGGPHKDTRSAARAWKWAAEIQEPNYAISGPLRSAEAIWEAPTWAEWDTVHVAVENYVGAGVFPAEDDGRYQWGSEVVLVGQTTDEA